jgi:SAM-dependent methyltransferase
MTGVRELIRHVMKVSYWRFRRSRYFWQIATGLSRVGENLGIESLVYNPLVFGWYHEQAVASAPGVMKTFARLFPGARTYVDVGAGSGAFAAEAQRLGLKAVAYERSRLGRLLAGFQGVEARPFDLGDVPHRRDDQFDLAYCFEVAEHVDARLGDELVRFCAAQAPLVVFTAAGPGQSGSHHVNLQPRSYWIERFTAEGLIYDDNMSRRLAEGFQAEQVKSRWLADNVMVFMKESGSGPPIT